MPGKPQPLFNNQAIVNPDGTPTLAFMRWAQQRQIDISEGITGGQAQQLIDEWAAARKIIAGHGLSGGGTLDADRTLKLAAMLGDLLDVDFSTPPTAGQALIFDAVEDAWKPGAGGGGGGVPEAPMDGRYYCRFNGTWVAVEVTPVPVAGAHDYWRVSFLDSQGGGYPACADIQFRPVAGTSVNPSGGSASESSRLYGASGDEFDGNPATGVVLGGGSGWMAYHYGAGAGPAPVQLMLRAHHDYFNAEGPKNITVDHSDDGVTWTVQTAINCGGAWTSNETRLFGI